MSKEKDKKSNVAIWKIDTSLEEFSGKTTEEVVSLVKNAYTIRRLKPIRLENATFEGKQVKAFWAMRFSDGMSDFLGEMLATDLTAEEKKEIFSSLNKDVVVFIYDEKDVFAITSGAGYFIIQEFVDERFPFEVAKRVLRGDFRSSEMRDLTSLVYSQSRNFRRDYNFSGREAFGKVWKKLTGRVDADVVAANTHIGEFVKSKKGKKSLSADAKSSFTFRKRVKIRQMFAAIKGVQELLGKKLTDDQKRVFAFLDTLKEVTKRETREALRHALADAALAFINGKETESDFDFCHPREMTKFLHGTGYEIEDGVEWDDAPTAGEVLVKLRETVGLLDLKDAEKFREGFLKLKMSFLEDDEGSTYTDDLWKYFHGEVELGGKKYFLIDGRWYEVVGEFLVALAQNFLDEVFGPSSILTDAVPFEQWATDDDEGEFNVKQGAKKGYYYGDKIFLTGEKGKIELFDLLYVVDGKIYIIQVKDGFGASVRDACSQIQMAAEIIEREIRTNDKAELKRYYLEFREKNPTVTEADFLKMLELERHYVLAASTRQEFTKDAFTKKKHKSDIAKFEVLGISHEFRAEDRRFHIAHIKKIHE